MPGYDAAGLFIQARGVLMKVEVFQRWASLSLVCMGSLCLIAVAGCGGDKTNPPVEQASGDKAVAAAPSEVVATAKASDQKISDTPADNGQKSTKKEDKGVPPPVFVGEVSLKEMYPNDKVHIERSVKRYSDDSTVNNGPFVSYYLSGKKLEEGNYEDGKKTGAWHMWYENGQEAKVENYVNGDVDGQWTLYTKDGLKERDVSYKDGKREGKWITYAADGKQPREQIEYHQDKPDGTSIVWNTDGKKISEMHFSKGQFDGMQQAWYPNGQMSKQAEYKDGKLNGKIIQWNDKGDKISEQTFADGKPVK